MRPRKSNNPFGDTIHRRLIASSTLTATAFFRSRLTSLLQGCVLTAHAASALGWRIGSMMRKQAPAPGMLRASMRPLCFFTMP